jgi:hypothetical protein
MRRLALLLATIVTIGIFSPMSLQAQILQASRDFPNTACGNAANVPAAGNIRLITSFLRLNQAAIFTLDTTAIAFPACPAPGATGGAVADTLAEALCAQCGVQGGVVTPPGCVFPAGINNSFDCSFGSSRITVRNNQTSLPFPAVVVENANPNTTFWRGYNHSTTAGNEVQVDLLPDLQVQISPQGFDGAVTFHVELVAGGGPSFTVNTAGKKTAQIAQEIGAGFITMGYPASNVTVLGAIARVRNINVLNNAAVKYVSIQGVPGMLVEVGNSAPEPSQAPAVSEWTVALFIGLVLLMGTWLLRRRLTPQAPQAV